MKRVKLCVRASQRPISASVNCTEDVIVGKEMVEAQSFHRETDLPN